MGAPPRWSRSTARPISSRASRTSAALRTRWPQSALAGKPVERGRPAETPSLPPARASRSAAARWSPRSARTSACGASSVLELRRASGRLRARHAHRRAGGARGRRRGARARSGDARGGQQPALPEHQRTCRPRCVAKEREILTEQAAARGQAARDRRQDGRGPAAQGAGRDHPAGPALRQGSGRRRSRSC